MFNAEQNVTVTLYVVLMARKQKSTCYHRDYGRHMYHIRQNRCLLQDSHSQLK